MVALVGVTFLFGFALQNIANAYKIFKDPGEAFICLGWVAGVLVTFAGVIFGLGALMVPCDKILDTAEKEHADIVALSGLITPSLDEMVHVASEMERRGFKIPLMIGGATTSRIHTAVKIAPVYSGPVAYTANASRVIGVAQKLVSEDLSAGYIKELREQQEEDRRQFAEANSSRKLLPIGEARKRAPALSFEGDFAPAEPMVPGITVYRNVSIAKLRRYIDWTPFFSIWGLKGKYPDILKSAEFGTEAGKLMKDAEAFP